MIKIISNLQFIMLKKVFRRISHLETTIQVNINTLLHKITINHQFVRNLFYKQMVLGFG